MIRTINTQAELFSFLLDGLSTPEPAADYPAAFSTFAEQMIACLRDFENGDAVLKLEAGGPICPCCGVQGTALFTAMLEELHASRGIRPCNRGVAILALTRPRSWRCPLCFVGSMR